MESTQFILTVKKTKSQQQLAATWTMTFPSKFLGVAQMNICSHFLSWQVNIFANSLPIQIIRCFRET
jgi:hypothetical protein